MDIDLTPREFKFSSKGKNYVVKEATSGAVEAYRSLILDNIEVGNDGKVRASGKASHKNILLCARCTFEVTPSGEVALTEAIVAGWNDRAVSQIAKWIEENSDLFAAGDADAALETRLRDAGIELTDEQRAKLFGPKVTSEQPSATG